MNFAYNKSPVENKWIEIILAGLIYSTIIAYTFGELFKIQAVQLNNIKKIEFKVVNIVSTSFYWQAVTNKKYRFTVDIGPRENQLYLIDFNDKILLKTYSGQYNIISSSFSNYKLAIEEYKK